MNWWWVVAPAAAVLLLLLARYVAGIVRLRKGLRRVAHGDLERPLSLDLPRGLRAAQRDLEAIARQARDLDRAAHRERAELTAVLASIPEGIFTVDRRLCVLQANRGVETMFQLSASPVGRTVVEAFGHAAMHKLVQEGVAERKPHRGEIVVEQGGTRQKQIDTRAVVQRGLEPGEDSAQRRTLLRRIHLPTGMQSEHRARGSSPLVARDRPVHNQLKVSIASSGRCGLPRATEKPVRVGTGHCVSGRTTKCDELTNAQEHAQKTSVRPTE